jgi:hypothetical protein
VHREHVNCPRCRAGRAPQHDQVGHLVGPEWRGPTQGWSPPNETRRTSRWTRSRSPPTQSPGADWNRGVQITNRSRHESKYRSLLKPVRKTSREIGIPRSLLTVA